MLLPSKDEIVCEEIFIDIPFTIVNDILPGYKISNWGRIYNGYTNRFLPQNLSYNKDKYITLMVNTSHGKEYVQPHRLLMMVFKPEEMIKCMQENNIYDPKCIDVNHKDGIKYHNWIWNLEWVSKSQNIQHALNTGLFNIGETRKNTKILNSEIESICKMIELGKSPKEISDEFSYLDCNVSTIVENIKSGYSWKHIASKYDFSNMYNKNNFTDDQIYLICKFFEDFGTNHSYKEILEFLNIDYSNMDKKELNKLNSCICSLRNKKTFKDICNKFKY